MSKKKLPMLNWAPVTNTQKTIFEVRILVKASCSLLIVNSRRLRVNETLPNIIFVLSYHVSEGKLVPEFCAEVRTSLGDSSAPPLRNFAPRLNIHALPSDKSHTII